MDIVARRERPRTTTLIAVNGRKRMALKRAGHRLSPCRDAAGTAAPGQGGRYLTRATADTPSMIGAVTVPTICSTFWRSLKGEFET